MPALFALGLCSAATWAAQAHGAPLTVEEAVTIGLKKNPQVAVAKAGMESAYSNYRSLATLNPITLGATHIQGTSTAPSLTGDNQDTDLDFGEVIDLSCQRRYQAASANAQFKSARYQYQETLLTTEQQIRDAYWSLAAARAQTQIADETLKDAERVYDLTVLQEKAGASPHGDVVRSSIDVANSKQDFLAAKSAEKSALIAFNAAVARPPTTEAELASSFNGEGVAPPDVKLGNLQDLDKQAIANRPLLKSADEQVHSADYAVRQADAYRFPDVSVDYQKSIRQPVDTLMFGVNFPLVDFGSVSQSVRAAKQTRKQAEAQRTQTLQQIQQQVAQAYTDMDTALKAAASYKSEILDPSVTLLEMARLGYKQGATGILPVLDAESTIRAARVGYINSVLAVYKAQDEILAAVGQAPTTESRKSK